MIRDAFAWIFRTVNSKLIGAEHSPWFKILKGAQFVSRIAYRRWRFTENRWTTIDNFDGTLSLKIDPSRPIGGGIYWTGFHEFRELIFLNRYLTSDMVLVDVGANLGEFTVFAAKRLTRGRVIAYEPLPDMIELLRHNISLNHFKNVTVVPCGLAEASKTVQLFTPESVDDNEGLATLFPGAVRGDSHPIEIRTLDSEADALGLNRLDVITMDIEGSELFALQGAVEVLKRFKPLVIIEINSKSFAAAGYTVERVLEFLKALQYAPFDLNKKGELQPVPALPQFGNIVFKPVL